MFNTILSIELKHEPSLKKPGDFTVAEGHEHPLVVKGRLASTLKY
jgi:hypothetical protein